jgi:hypothetical protein
MAVLIDEAKGRDSRSDSIVDDLSVDCFSVNYFFAEYLEYRGRAVLTAGEKYDRDGGQCK